ncbi:STAS domain-containing protein [Streptomyces sp. NPDC001941]|uniref:STAS domain-containing protein n=1 Tax=Streptomyces sp. NPDC001941 TaxID=3154659 RepID=UPI00332E431B
MVEELAFEPSELRVPFPESYGRLYRAQGRAVAELRGEIDIEAALVLGPCLDVLTLAEGLELVVDLGRVDFFDCSGLTLLCRARRRVLDRGGHLRVVCARPFFLRVLRTAGLLGQLPTYPTLEAALDDAS